LKFRKVDLESLKIKVYADLSFANNEDLTSQLGYIIMLTDKTGKCNILYYSSHKSRRVTGSVLGGEAYAFADAFDQAFILRHDRQSIIKRKVPLTILTDSKSLFDAGVGKNSPNSNSNSRIFGESEF
jgi:hypothetical protein